VKSDEISKSSYRVCQHPGRGLSRFKISLIELTDAGCTHAQGFHLGKPMPRAEFEALTGVREYPKPIRSTRPSMMS
jgi:hypothetical protein